MGLGIGHGLNDEPLDRSALDRVKEEAARKGRALTAQEGFDALTAPAKRNAYVIDTDDVTAAIAQLVTAFKVQDPSVGKLRVVCHDGSTVTIAVKQPKPAKKGSKK